MKKIFILAFAVIMGFVAVARQSIYEFTVKNQDGTEMPMEKFRGKVLLIVNTATECGFTPQYEELQNLQNKFGRHGFEILDFPCNQFGEQAPGADEEIHNFCTSKYHIEFHQFAKIDVNGDNAEPLFRWLKEMRPFEGFDLNSPIGKQMDQMLRKSDPNYDKNPDIKWNFTKFLIDRDGNVVARFEPTVSMREVGNRIVEFPR